MLIVIAFCLDRVFLFSPLSYYEKEKKIERSLF